MPAIDVPLLIVGHGPAALVAAKVLSGSGLTSLIAGHEPLDLLEPVVLDQQSVAVLEPHGVLGVLRPYAASQYPFTIVPNLFEQGLKHHCVVDMLITVYDGMSLIETIPDGVAITGVLTDGRSRWPIRADTFLDVSHMSTNLNAAIHEAAAFATELRARII